MVEDVINKTTDGSKIYAHNMVRVQSDTQKIVKFFQPVAKLGEHSSNMNDADKDQQKTNEHQIEETYEHQVGKTNKNEVGRTSDHQVEQTNEHQTRETTDDQIKIPDIIIDQVHDDVLENSIVREPAETNTLNKMPDKWKSYTGNQANISYVDPKESFKTRTFKYERVETKLTSIKQLRFAIENNCSLNLREILANLIFIACIDSHKSLIQHSTKLYLCDTTRLTEELFYETMLYDFQNFGLIKLSNPLPMEELFVLGLSSSSEWNSELGAYDQSHYRVKLIHCNIRNSRRIFVLKIFSLIY